MSFEKPPERIFAADSEGNIEETEAERLEKKARHVNLEDVGLEVTDRGMITLKKEKRSFAADKEGIVEQKNDGELTLRERAELQRDLILNSGVGAEEWIERYAKKFSNLVDIDASLPALVKEDREVAIKHIAGQLEKRSDVLHIESDVVADPREILDAEEKIELFNRLRKRKAVRDWVLILGVWAGFTGGNIVHDRVKGEPAGKDIEEMLNVTAPETLAALDSLYENIWVTEMRGGFIFDRSLEEKPPTTSDFVMVMPVFDENNILVMAQGALVENKTIESSVMTHYLKTFPTGWVEGEVADFSQKMSSQEIREDYSIEGESFASYSRDSNKIEFHKTSREGTADYVMHAAAHELAHANDWESDNQMSESERAELLLAVSERLDHEDRYMSRYVESITNEDKKTERYNKAVEYWAEISAVYFTAPANLHHKDFEIVDAIVRDQDEYYALMDSIEERFEILHFGLQEAK